MAKLELAQERARIATETEDERTLVVAANVRCLPWCAVVHLQGEDVAPGRGDPVLGVVELSGIKRIAMAQSKRGIALLGRQELLEETSLVAVIERRLPNRQLLLASRSRFGCSDG